MSKAIDSAKYQTLTFDCYGTLIDWELGLLGYIQPLLQSYYINTIDEFVLTAFSEYELLEQAAGGSYREVLAGVMARYAHRLGFTATEDNLTGLADSIEFWPAFPDAGAACRTLEKHFQLAVVSNVDDDLLAYSQAMLDTSFDQIITAQQVGHYKPHPALFETALERVEGPVLHVAQSRFHDILPATALGLDTVWINRPSLGANRPVDAEPTWTFTSLAEFAAAIG